MDGSRGGMARRASRGGRRANAKMKTGSADRLRQACAPCAEECAKAPGRKPPSPTPLCSFFKIMLGNFRETLTVPPKYARLHGNLFDEIIHLEDSDGRRWEVEVCKMDGRLAFRQGWDKFVLEHSINFGEFLIFSNAGTSSFTVRVYGRSGCERLNFSAKTHRDDVPPRSSRRKRSVSELMSPSHGNARKPRGETEASAEVACIVICDEEDEEEDNGGDPCESRKKEVAATVAGNVSKSHEGDTESKETTEDDDDPEVMIPAEKPIQSECGEEGIERSPDHTEMDRLPADEVIKDGPGLLDAEVVSAGAEEDGKVNEREMSEPFTEAAVFKEDEYEVAKAPPFSFSFVVRTLTYHELPGPIPPTGLKKVLQRKVVLLQDPATRVWPVLYVETSTWPRFLGGWEAFVGGNNLRVGDSCHFELVDATSELLFHVLISRAAEEPDSADSVF